MRAQDLSIYRKAVRTEDGRLPPRAGARGLSHVRTPPHLRTPPYSDSVCSCYSLSACFPALTGHIIGELHRHSQGHADHQEDCRSLDPRAIHVFTRFTPHDTHQRTSRNPHLPFQAIYPHLGTECGNLAVHSQLRLSRRATIRKHPENRREGYVIHDRTEGKAGARRCERGPRGVRTGIP